MGFIGGGLRQELVTRIKDADPGRLLAVPIDVARHSAAAMVCDFWGEVIAPPFDFDLDEEGFKRFSITLARAEAEREATWTRIGLESAGHYHRPLQARLEAAGMEVTLFNPAQVKENRNQDLLHSLKSDAIDLAAMAELLIRGKGRLSTMSSDAVAIQGVLMLHRARKIRARTALKLQIHAQLDLVFPGLARCVWNPIESNVGRVMLDEGLTPERVRRLGNERFLRFCAKRDVRVTRIKAAEIVACAHRAFALDTTMSQVHLPADGRHGSPGQARPGGERHRRAARRDPARDAGRHPHDPAARLGGAGLELWRRCRRHHPLQECRAGLSDVWTGAASLRVGRQDLDDDEDLAGRTSRAQRGDPGARQALRQGHPNFARYAAGLKARGKPGGVIQCAVGSRANRLAFAMMRDQTPFDPFRW